MSWSRARRSRIWMRVREEACDRWSQYLHEAGLRAGARPRHLRGAPSPRAAGADLPKAYWRLPVAMMRSQ